MSTRSEVRPLGAVAGDGVAVLEVAMLCRPVFDLPTAFQPRGDTPIRRNGLDHGKVAVANSKLMIGSRELNSVPNREVVCDLSIHTDAGEPARIIGGELT